MSTGTSIIQDALRKIGAFSPLQPADPDTIVGAMETLNAMMQLWRSQGIMQNAVPLEVPADDMYEPFDARNAIVDNLALYLAPNFDNGKVVVSQDLRRNARLGFADIETLYGKYTIPNKVPSSTLPKGAGNSKGDWVTNPFFNPENGDTLSG